MYKLPSDAPLKEKGSAKICPRDLSRGAELQ